jgi:hypothetical protein
LARQGYFDNVIWLHIIVIIIATRYKIHNYSNYILVKERLCGGIYVAEVWIPF